jgi:beta-lactamase regulating signal transducer with metallopeptidase domain
MSPWIETTGWTLIHFVWQGALIALATALALRICRRSTPQLRYGLACAGLAAMLAAVAITATTGGLARGDAPFSIRAGVEHVTGAAVTPSTSQADVPAISGGPGANTAVTSAPLLTTIVWVWLAGVSLLVVRLAGGCWRVHRLRTQALASAPSHWQATADRLARRLTITAPFRIVESMLVDAPMVAGWWRPLIVLPVAALANMTTAQVEALIAHELAHIRRHDYAVNLLQTAAEALLFFHPGVWWVSRRIRQEREHCCDDVAVGVAEEAEIYVEALAMLAAWPSRAVGPTVGATDGALLRRARRLLGVPREDQGANLGGLVFLGAAASLAVAMLTLGPAPSASAQPAAQGDLVVRQTDHFEISFAPALDLHAARIATEAERAYERVSVDLRHSLAFKVPLILFATGGELEARVQSRTPLRGSTDHILFAVDRPADQWLGLLTHEVAHVFGFDILPGNTAPSWIAEGLAEYERRDWDPADLVMLRTAVRAGTVPRLSSLQPASGDRRTVDVYGHAAFDFIESRWGKPGVRQFLVAMRRSATAGDPFQAAFQLTADEFDRGFDSYLRTRLAAERAAAPPAFDAASTVRLEGVVSFVGTPTNPRLACIELIVPEIGDDSERWSIECGDAGAADVIAALKPGQRVVITGIPAVAAGAKRLLIRSLVRPDDGFNWQGRG